jgi:hypothetical protein
MNEGKTFYTLTDRHTEYTNSRSKRFDSFEEAKKEAEFRLSASQSCKGIYILEAIALVEPVPVPTVVTKMLVRKHE